MNTKCNTTLYSVYYGLHNANSKIIRFIMAFLWFVIELQIKNKRS